ncbi:hypothetical protein KY317_03770 [Candidatus Woesearchaeota archaeon]|nr:hypothetical protein [Candidatus Woesearchaeota archaeon]
MKKKKVLKKIRGKLEERSSAKKIKKSDDIIVTAKTPIQEILKQIELAKKVKGRLKKPEKKAPEKKKPKIKIKPKILKIPDEITSDLYQRELQTGVDYGKLFEYLGSGKDAYSQYVKGLEYKQEEVHEHSYELGEEKLERLIRKEIIDAFMFGNDPKGVSDIKEKERFDYWKQFNQMWVQIKVDLLGFGYRHA